MEQNEYKRLDLVTNSCQYMIKGILLQPECSQVEMNWKDEKQEKKTIFYREKKDLEKEMQSLVQRWETVDEIRIRFGNEELCFLVSGETLITRQKASILEWTIGGIKAELQPGDTLFLRGWNHRGMIMLADFVQDQEPIDILGQDFSRYQKIGLHSTVGRGMSLYII